MSRYLFLVCVLLSGVVLPGHADNNNSNNNQQPEVIYEPEVITDPIFVPGYEYEDEDVYYYNNPCTGGGCEHQEEQAKQNYEAQQNEAKEANEMREENEMQHNYRGGFIGGSVHSSGGGRR